MPTKVSMIFRYSSEPVEGSFFTSKTGGWSESHWRPSDDLTDQAAQNLARLRMQLTSALVEMTEFRVTQYTVVNAKLQPQGTRLISQNMRGVARLQTDIPQMALQINWRATAPLANSSVSDIRGVPDEYVQGGEYTRQKTYNDKVVAFLSHMVSNAYGFMGTSMGADAPKVKVLALAANVLSVASGSLIQAGDWVKLYRVRLDGGAKLSGEYHVVSVTGTNVTLEGIPTGSVISVPNGSVRRVIPTFCDYGQATIAGIRTHKIGRPFGVYRGRQQRA